MPSLTSLAFATILLFCVSPYLADAIASSVESARCPFEEITPPFFDTRGATYHGDDLEFDNGGIAHAVVGGILLPNGTFTPSVYGHEVSVGLVAYPDQLPILPVEAPPCDTNDTNASLPTNISLAKVLYDLDPPSIYRKIKVSVDLETTANDVKVSIIITWGAKRSIGNSSTNDTSTGPVSPAFIPAGFAFDNQTNVYRFKPPAQECVSTSPEGTALTLIPFQGAIVGYRVDVPRSLLLRSPTSCYAIPQPAAYQQTGYYPTLWCIRSSLEFYRLSFEGLRFNSGVPLVFHPCSDNAAKPGPVCHDPYELCCGAADDPTCQPPNTCVASSNPPPRTTR